jgi:hypothetical protein
MINLTIPQLVTDYFIEQGYIPNINDIHTFLNFTIYTPDYFCPKSNVTNELKITNNTIAIHHYHGSWTN